MKKLMTMIIVCLGLLILSGLPCLAETLDTRVGELSFTSGYPDDETVKKIYDELDFQRAVQVYLWALPMASYGALAEAHLAVGCNSHTVFIADQLAEPKQLILTANQDTLYLSGVLDLRDGPMVMVLPAGLLGTLNNIWQQPLCDLGGPFSPEQSRGGRFLILPPGYDGPLPEFHYHVVKADTNIVVFYVRAVPQSRDDIPKLTKLMHSYQQYKLSESQPPPGNEIYLLKRNGF